MKSKILSYHSNIIVEALEYLEEESRGIAEQRESEGEDATGQRDRIKECQSALRLINEEL